MHVFSHVLIIYLMASFCGENYKIDVCLSFTQLK